MDRSFALAGGLAVSARAEPRLTRDTDLVVAVDGDADAESLLAELQARDYEISALIEQQTTGRLAAARLIASEDRDRTITDLLFASSGIEVEVVERAERLEVLPGLVMPVASVGSLIAMKLLARDDRRRPTDADDLRALRLVAKDQDWDEAATAVRLITERDAHRNRDLRAALSHLREHGAF